MSTFSSSIVPDKINLVLGALLFVSPWVLGFSGDPNAALNAQIVGALIFALALLEMFAFNMWEEWASLAAGVWLIVAPFVLGFNGLISALAIHIAIGLTTILFAIWSASDHSTSRPT